MWEIEIEIEGGSLYIRLSECVMRSPLSLSLSCCELIFVYDLQGVGGRERERKKKSADYGTAQIREKRFIPFSLFSPGYSRIPAQPANEIEWSP